MTAAALPPTARAWGQLSLAERKTGVQALEKAVAEVAAGGVDHRSLEIIATASAHQLVLGAEGLWRLTVEHPTHARGSVPTTARAPGMIVDHVLTADQRDEQLCAGVFRQHPLADALRLLVRSDGPQAELERRRAEVADRRRRSADAQVERESALQERQHQDALWRATNARRIEAWARTPAEQQRLHVLADRFPQHAELLRAWAQLLGQPPTVGLGMPESFERGLVG